MLLTLNDKLKYVHECQHVIYTDGCADLCHPGHMGKFAKSADKGDCLIFGIMSDAAIKSYKGDSRPIWDENTRILAVANSMFVDFVIGSVDLWIPDCIPKEKADELRNKYIKDAVPLYWNDEKIYKKWLKRYNIKQFDVGDDYQDDVSKRDLYYPLPYRNTILTFSPRTPITSTSETIAKIDATYHERHPTNITT